MDAWLGRKAAAGPSTSEKAAGKARAPLAPVKVDKPAKRIDPESLPWTERHRPKTLDDVAAQEQTVAVLKKTLAQANVRSSL